jgi:hypothetical protein
LKVKLNDKEIKRESQTKMLGLYIDDKLNFKKHIQIITNKLSKLSYILLKIRGYVPQSIMLNLFYALGNPHIIYNIPIWASTSSIATKPLETVYKRLIRIISGTNDFKAHTSPLYKSLKILKIKDALHLESCSHIYKVIHCKEPALIANIINKNQLPRTRNLRFSHKLRKPVYTLKKARRSIAYSGISSWNSIPLEIKGTNSYRSFRQRLKRHLLTLY